MGKIAGFLFSFIILSTGISAQVVYDTIPHKPSLQFMGTFILRSLPMFGNIDSYLDSSLANINFKDPDYRSGTVVVSTIFGTSGVQRETKIIKSVSTYCDSIAFYAVLGVKNWIPARNRAHYEDYEFLFPIHFSVEENQKKFSSKRSFLNSSPSEYQAEKRKYEFYYSSDTSQKLLSDFDYLKDFIADELSDSTYVHVSEWDKPKRRNRVQIEITNNTSGKIAFLIRDSERKRLLFYLSAKRKFYLEKGKQYQIIGFMPIDANESKLSIDTVDFTTDTLFIPDYRFTTKSELLEELDAAF